MLCRIRRPVRTTVVARRPAVSMPARRNVHARTPGKKLVTLIPGDGVGPEVANAVVGILQAANAPVEFERFDDLPHDKPFPPDLLVRYGAIVIILHYFCVVCV